MKRCPVCKGQATRKDLRERHLPCRACLGSGDYPDPLVIISQLSAHHIRALFYSPDMAKDKDGRVLTRLVALGLCGDLELDGFRITPLGKDIVRVLAAKSTADFDVIERGDVSEISVKLDELDFETFNRRLVENFTCFPDVIVTMDRHACPYAVFSMPTTDVPLARLIFS